MSNLVEKRKSIEETEVIFYNACEAIFHYFMFNVKDVIFLEEDPDILSTIQEDMKVRMETCNCGQSLLHASHGAVDGESIDSSFLSHVSGAISHTELSFLITRVLQDSCKTSIYFRFYFF